jgi:hypothetical protein
MFFAVEEVSWIASDISTAANHSRDHRATRRISSTVTLQCSARTQPITLDSLLVLWQDNIHPNLFMFCSYQWSVCLFVPCVWDSLWCVWLDTYLFDETTQHSQMKTTMVWHIITAVWDIQQFIRLLCNHTIYALHHKPSYVIPHVDTSPKYAPNTCPLTTS